MPILVTFKVNENAIKTKTISYSQHFLHYKSMGNIFVSQGQVTPTRVVQSGPKSNWSEILCLSILSASLNKSVASTT